MIKIAVLEFIGGFFWTIVRITGRTNISLKQVNIVFEFFIKAAKHYFKHN
jgi:hypothetical protein